MASGCSLPVETPFSNIDAMLDAVREIGWPVDGDALERELPSWRCDAWDIETSAFALRQKCKNSA